MIEILKMQEFWYATLIALMIVFALFYIKSRLKKIAGSDNTFKRKHKVSAKQE